MKRVVYIGTWATSYNGTQGGMVYVMECNQDKWDCLQRIDIGKSVSTLSLDAERQMLFVVCETNYHASGDPGGEIIAFRVDPENGTLAQRKNMNSCGAFPIALEYTERMALVLNHGSNLGKVCETYWDDEGNLKTRFASDEANLCLFWRNPDGTLGKASDCYHFYGTGGLPVFQDSPAPHALYYDRQRNIYFVPERGNDRVSMYRIEEAEGKIQKVGDFYADRETGPRNIALKGRFCYVLAEIEPVVAVYREFGGSFEKVQTVRTVPEDFCTDQDRLSFQYPHPSGIAVHPSGRYLYTLTRTLDCLTVFVIAADDGKLAPKCFYPLIGKNPRQIICEEDYLIVICLDSENVVEIALDGCGIPENQRIVAEGIPRAAVYTG